MTLSGKTALAVVAHPDDEFHCLGSLIKLARSGNRIAIAVATDGRLGIDQDNLRPEEVAAIRRAEMARVADAVGADLVWLGFADATLEVNLPALKAKLAETVRAIRPDVFFTHDGWRCWELHSDHRTLGLAAAEAAYLANGPWYFPEQVAGGLAPHAPATVFLFNTDAPTYSADIATAVEAKLAAAQLHSSQNRRGTDYGDRIARHLGWLREANPAALREEFRQIGKDVVHFD